MRVRLEPLDEPAFRDFGQILANPGETWRKDFAANLSNRRPSALPNLALIRAEAAAFPLKIHELEQHKHSSQTFLPLDVREYMVIVCKDDGFKDDGFGAPNLATLRAFRISRAVGVNYDCGV